MRVLTVMLATCAVLLALIANLLLKPKAATKMAAWFACTANVLGFLLYGYGYAVLEKNILMAILKTIYAVFGMFLGKDSMGDMKALPFFELSWIKMLLYLAQMMALYITASAAISAFGTGLVNRLRALTLRFGPVDLIYGLNQDTLSIGRELMEEGRKVVFAAGSADEKNRQEVRRLRGVLYSDETSLAGGVRFLKRFGIGARPRKITLFAIGQSPAENIAYAEKILRAMKELQVPSSGTRLVLCADGDYDASVLQEHGDVYGFGSVVSFERPYLAARILLRNVPPYETMTFTPEGQAEGNFEAMVIGFGEVGQELLKGLVQHGQFPGSHFHAAVFDCRMGSIDGSFRYQYQGLLDACDIDLIEADGRSFQVYEYIRKHAGDLNYIAVATGDAAMNEKIARELVVALRDTGSTARLTECSESCVIEVRYDQVQVTESRWPLFTEELITTEKLDAMAMILNQYYNRSNGKSAEENWQACDYFSRRSCRAAADYIPAMLKIAGHTEEEVAAQGWHLSEDELKTLGKAEHDRWCAFHYVNGYRPMTWEEWQERADAWAETHQQIGKDAARRRHICLMPWEELPALARKEEKVTGRPVDYWQRDIDNILAYPELLKEQRN